MPLMTERMVEALEIEGKVHEVHWYDDEGHGWERRENRRDAFERILAFLKRHVPSDERARPSDPGNCKTSRPHSGRLLDRDGPATAHRHGLDPAILPASGRPRARGRSWPACRRRACASGTPADLRTFIA